MTAAKAASNGNHRLCLKSKPQVKVSEAYRQDKPRKARRARGVSYPQANKDP